MTSFNVITTSPSSKIQLTIILREICQVHVEIRKAQRPFSAGRQIKDPTEKALFANTFGSVLAEEPERFRSPSKRKILYFLISKQKCLSA
ncbi:hypothetical protein HMPREF3291_01930 [Bacillus sp. HMSC76G11]|nr:hypothetical protein HMPREF3291_01930 [Bacillus sp. HMSC76G11]